MRYAITGGAGFIGSNLAEYLAIEKMDEIVIIDNLSSGKISNLKNIINLDNVSFIEGDIRDQDNLIKAFSGVDGIFHHAAVASVQKSFTDPSVTNEVNISGTLNVLIAAKKCKIPKTIIASSASIYGNNSNIPLKETESASPMSPYAIQKISIEQYADVFSRIYETRSVCLRYFNVYGPKQDPNSPYSGVISIFKDKISSGLPITIFGDGMQTRDFIYIKDVIKANILAMEGPASGIFNIATGKETSLLEISSYLMEILGNRVEILKKDRRPGDIQRSCADISKAINDPNFGFYPEYDIKSGLSDLIKNNY